VPPLRGVSRRGARHGADRGRDRGRGPRPAQNVALYQKVVILCVVLYLLAVLTQFGLPEELRPLLGLGVLAVILVGTVFVFLLSVEVYSVGRGILLGVGTMIPCVGLFVLLHVNQKAVQVLREAGVSVGLLGARTSDPPP